MEKYGDYGVNYHNRTLRNNGKLANRQESKESLLEGDTEAYGIN